MIDISSVDGIEDLWSTTTGDPRIRVAILDGPVDVAHSCFDRSQLEEHWSYLQDRAGRRPSPMRDHGTHVASIVFGRHGSEVPGVAPSCTGLLFPVFSDRRRKLSQLDLSRAIEAAVEAGAHVINVSGGQLTNAGEAEHWLERAIQFCADNNVLLVAAAGNDGCACAHVPAALPTVLAVGAMDEKRRPLDFSNWAPSYGAHGVLAPGRDVLGGATGGGTVRKSGTSLACPVVAGVAGLLLSQQLARGRQADPHAVRAAILHGADPCDPQIMGDCSRFLVGTLNVLGAQNALTAIERNELPMFEQAEAPELNSSDDRHTVTASCACEKVARSPAGAQQGDSPGLVADFEPSTAPPAARRASAGAITAEAVDGGVRPSQTTSELTYTFQPGSGLVYALGTLGYDFGTEARRDSFKQLMSQAFGKEHRPGVGPIPQDARDMVLYLKYLYQDKDGNPATEVDPADPTGLRLVPRYYYLDEAKSLIWTLNLELTPIYGIEPLGPFSRCVYEKLVDLLDCQIQREDHQHYVERVSIPGLLAGRTVRLFSGQVLPIVELENTRGLYGWKVNDLISAAKEAIKGTGAPLTQEQELAFAKNLEAFLNRIYFDFSNLGTTAPDRALNYSVTNIVQASMVFGEFIRDGLQLDSIEVLKSPTCRLDSDCWDIKLKFFMPTDLTQSVQVARFTVDVSDKMPVTLGSLRVWAQRY